MKSYFIFTIFILQHRELKFGRCHNNMAAAVNCQKAREMNASRYMACAENDLWRARQIYERGRAKNIDLFSVYSEFSNNI